MTDVHAIAHRGCGGNLIYRTEGGFKIVGQESRLICERCGDHICGVNEILNEAYTDADDLKQLVIRLFRGDVELIDEDPEVWDRKTSDDQVELHSFEEGDSQ